MKWLLYCYIDWWVYQLASRVIRWIDNDDPKCFQCHTVLLSHTLPAWLHHDWRAWVLQMDYKTVKYLLHFFLFLFKLEEIIFSHRWMGCLLYFRVWVMRMLVLVDVYVRSMFLRFNLLWCIIIIKTKQNGRHLEIWPAE